MKSQYSETKSESFHSLAVRDYLQPAEKRVISIFYNRPLEFTLTRKQIAVMTGLELSAVCGRVNSLITNKRLVARGERKDPFTGKNQELLGLPVPVQLDLLEVA